MIDQPIKIDQDDNNNDQLEKDIHQKHEKHHKHKKDIEIEIEQKREEEINQNEDQNFNENENLEIGKKKKESKDKEKQKRIEGKKVKKKEKQKDEQQLSFQITQTISQQQLIEIKQELLLIKEESELSEDLFNRLLNALQTIRQSQELDKTKLSEEMNKLILEISEFIPKIIKNIIKDSEAVKLGLKSGFIQQLIEFAKSISFDQIPMFVIQSINYFIHFCSEKQIQKMNKMQIIQSMIPSLNNEDDSIKAYILDSFVNITKNGWGNSNSNYSRSSPFSLSPQKQQSLEYLLSLPNPFLSLFEKQGIIKTLIDNVIMNNEITLLNWKLAYILLDILYIEGIQLPSKIQEQIIFQLCDEVKSIEDNNSNSMEVLSFLAINRDNHEDIIASHTIESVAAYIKKGSDNSHEDWQCNINSLNIIQNLFLFGSTQTQKLIRKQIIINNLKKLFTWDEVYSLIFSFQDPESMKQLVRIRRIVKNRNGNGNIELIKAGLMLSIQEIMVKIIQMNDNEGGMIVIGDIINTLVKGNLEACSIIIEETGFVQELLSILISLPVSKLKEEDLSILYYLSFNIPIKIQKIFFSKDFITLMSKMLMSQDEYIKSLSIEFIKDLIFAEIERLKEGEQHPFLQQFTKIGFITMLFQLLRVKENEDIQNQIQQTLVFLFKASPFPIEYREIIDDLKEQNKFDELIYLVECPENQEAILENEFEKQLFKDDYYLLKYLLFILPILKYGSDENKKRIAFTVKYQVDNLLNIEHFEQLSQKHKWKDKQKKITWSKSTEILSIINKIIDEKQGKEEENINCFTKK